MKKRNPYIRKYHPFLLWIWMVWLCSCSTDLAKSSDEAEVNDFARVEAEDVSYSPTRAMGMDLTSFSISVYNSKTDRLLADKVQYKITDEGLTSDRSWRMANAEMKAIGVSPTMDITENVTLTATDHFFDYTVPTTNQTMLKIGSNMSFTKASSDNKLQMKFVNALSLFTIRARNELKMEDDEGNEYDVQIYVKGVTLHNLIAKGRFTFTGNYKGTWAPVDEVYADYTQNLKDPVLLTSTTFVNVMDSIFVFLPQAPQNFSWTPSGATPTPETDAISYANANHKCYIELRCAITTVRNNKTIYVWGNEDTYPPIYFPYLKKYCAKSWNVINRQAVYNLSIVKAEALDSDGKPIKPQAQNDEYGQFENAVFIEVAPTDDLNKDNVDDWGDPDLIDVTI